MISKSDEVVKEKIFKYQNKNYIARLYTRKGKASVYGEIVHADNGERVANMKGLAREILKPHGIEIPTGANEIVTHGAVKILINFLETNNLK